MASTSRVLILSIFLLLSFSCSNSDHQAEDRVLEVMLLECKPIEWPDGSTSFSIYATIGTNQTKVANAPACQAVEKIHFKDHFPDKEIVSLLNSSVGDSLLFYYLEKTAEGLRVGFSTKKETKSNIITTYKNGKFFFK